MEAADIALICRALGDPTRVRIVQMLMKGEKCACKLLSQLEIRQPTLSHHMKILCDAGLVEVRREGKWSHYSLNEQTLTEFKEFIEMLTGTPVA